MKKDASYFDKSYFEEQSGEHRSNYTRVGGYKNFAQGLGWAEVAKRLLGDHDPRTFYVLDVGCAYGLLVKEFRKLGAQAYGIDISKHAIDSADPDVREFLSLRNIGTDITPRPPDETNKLNWDLITSFDVLEHAEDAEEVEQIIGDFARVSIRQYHRVNTGQYDNQAFDGDGSHGTRIPLYQWQEIARTKEIFWGRQPNSIVVVE